MDRFIRDTPGLPSVTFPANALKRNKNAFSLVYNDILPAVFVFLQVEEFNQSIILSNFNMVCGVVFVIWKWVWVRMKWTVIIIPVKVGMIFSELYLRPLMKVWMSRSQNLTLVLNQLPLSVGCTKEGCYRKALAKAAKLMKNGQDVPCVLYPEPHNPVDARAIAFKL